MIFAAAISAMHSASFVIEMEAVEQEARAHALKAGMTEEEWREVRDRSRSATAQFMHYSRSGGSSPPATDCDWVLPAAAGLLFGALLF